MALELKKKYKIWASAFIPYAKTPPAPIILPPSLGGYRGTLVLDGDNRGFGDVGGNARLWHLLYIDLDRDIPMVSHREDAGYTTGVISYKGLSKKDSYIKTGSPPKPPIPKITREGDVISVSITGSAQTQLLPGFMSPIIAYTFQLSFDLKGRRLTYIGNWRRWLFPAYELNVSSLGNILEDRPTFNPADTPLNYLGDSNIWRSGSEWLRIDHREDRGMPQY